MDEHDWLAKGVIPPIVLASHILSPIPTFLVVVVVSLHQGMQPRSTRVFYSPKCLEGEFCELRLLGVLGSCARLCNPSHLSSLVNWAGLPLVPPSTEGGQKKC
jgi:hypothetical protein